MTRLFREAEEREESDGEKMLRSVVEMQDMLLSLGIDDVINWLKAAERLSCPAKCRGLIFSNTPIDGTILPSKDIRHATNPSQLGTRVHARNRQKWVT